MFAEFMEAYGMDVIGTAFVLIAGLLGYALRQLAKRWVDTEEKQKIVSKIVMFVEQVYSTLCGVEKYKIAVDVASKILKAKGISCSDEELRVLIESAVGEFNDAFRDSRARHIEAEITESAVDEEPEDNMTPETKAFLVQKAAEQEEIRARAKAYCEAHPECVREDKPEGE